MQMVLKYWLVLRLFKLDVQVLAGVEDLPVQNGMHMVLKYWLVLRLFG